MGIAIAILEQLRPLYQMEIGSAGESCALYIAKKLGLSNEILQIEAREAYGEESIRLEKKLEIENGKQERTNKIAEKGSIPKLVFTKEKQNHNMQVSTFQRGDSVIVHPQNVIGIVVKPDDEQGNVLIQIKKRKSISKSEKTKAESGSSRALSRGLRFFNYL